ncbi:hypothetical protein [Flavobacterium chungbukense]|uniref:hypothetical protein n=1 Tax=Flavobacterium chungbukense TaxID=877464 RepID=UPI001E623F72|nr:hypothetical protein [Flavobacterium chungbukense]
MIDIICSLNSNPLILGILMSEIMRKGRTDALDKYGIASNGSAINLNCKDIPGSQKYPEGTVCRPHRLQL